MRMALALAARGTGATYPNPCVGAVVVRDGRVVGKGRTAPTGGPHAEVRALRRAGDLARGSTVYVTLEPCAHHGRTPPCSEALIAAGVRRVVAAVRDPSAAVAGRGFAQLRAAGVEVREDCLGPEGEEVHAHYLHHVRTGAPFVTLKAAISVDGRIATKAGDSQWITGELARRQVHRTRARHHAIAVGAETLLCDDPQLTVRAVRGEDPVRVVFDPALRCVAGSVRPRALAEGTVVLHGPKATRARRSALAATGARGIEVASAQGRLDIGAALVALGALDLRSLMVEGGGRLLGAFMAASAWQELHLYTAPVVLGEGRPVFAGFEPPRVQSAPRLRRVSEKRLGDDLWTVFRPG